MRVLFGLLNNETLSYPCTMCFCLNALFTVLMRRRLSTVLALSIDPLHSSYVAIHLASYRVDLSHRCIHCSLYSIGNFLCTVLMPSLYLCCTALIVCCRCIFLCSSGIRPCKAWFLAPHHAKDDSLKVLMTCVLHWLELNCGLSLSSGFSL